METEDVNIMERLWTQFRAVALQHWPDSRKSALFDMKGAYFAGILSGYQMVLSILGDEAISNAAKTEMVTGLHDVIDGGLMQLILEKESRQPTTVQ